MTWGNATNEDYLYLNVYDEYSLVLGGRARAFFLALSAYGSLSSLVVFTSETSALQRRLACRLANLLS